MLLKLRSKCLCQIFGGIIEITATAIYNYTGTEAITLSYETFFHAGSFAESQSRIYSLTFTNILAFN